MREKRKQSRVVRDLIRIGIFTALWIVISFLMAFTIAFFPPILLVLPCLLGLVAGIIYVVMLSKLEMPGGILISSAMMGLCLYTMVPYGMMFFCTVGGGLLGEIFYNVLGKKTAKATYTGAGFTMLGMALGEYIPFIYMQDAFRILYEGSDTMSIAEWCMEIATFPVMLLLCAITVALTCLGCFWGNNMVRKHFSKSHK